ncbi:hypothetical protein ITJ57_01810 [Plantibacter sp. VKM Ac-2880]|uniref:hypothetical protein n=1 Tax=Plantibacter sp. VKM Ac-2880 TaxID=2783827 RepID=UPI0018901762|nr:hypothetical protein [Plantibacter sp. VKM Ac-2880]MBF4567487.1 hypothetical protein [Plantibacter sp. VKM Ac-2880]
MKHLTYSDKALLIDDATADALLEYAALLARAGDADSVSVTAYSGDGQTVEATFLLDAGAPLMCETTHSTMNEPDNAIPLSYLREQIALRSSPPSIASEERHPTDHGNAYDL